MLLGLEETFDEIARRARICTRCSTQLKHHGIRVLPCVRATVAAALCDTQSLVLLQRLPQPAAAAAAAARCDAPSIRCSFVSNSRYIVIAAAS